MTGPPPQDAAFNTNLAPLHLPRITIQFCTQCKWMLRAAYFAQELLSTFSTSLGEVSLVPSTGGVFTVDLTHELIPQLENREGASNERDERWNTQTMRIWDRKAEGGFPETKALKKLVRDIIDPSRDLGHVDRQKAPPTLPDPAVPKESSCSGIVSVQNKKSSQMTTTIPETTTHVARREGNKNNYYDDDDGGGTKSWGNDEGEIGGPLRTAVEIENGPVGPIPEMPQQQEQKDGNNRVIYEDCT